MPSSPGPPRSGSAPWTTASPAAVLLRDRVREGVQALHRERLREWPRSAAWSCLPATAAARARIAIASGSGHPQKRGEAGLLPEQKLDRIRQLTSEGQNRRDGGRRHQRRTGPRSGRSRPRCSAAPAITLRRPPMWSLSSALARSASQEFSCCTSRRAAGDRPAQNIILFAGLLNLTAVLMAATGQVGPHRSGTHPSALGRSLRDDELAAPAAGSSGTRPMPASPPSGPKPGTICADAANRIDPGSVGWRGSPRIVLRLWRPCSPPRLPHSSF